MPIKYRHIAPQIVNYVLYSLIENLPVSSWRLIHNNWFDDPKIILLKVLSFWNQCFHSKLTLGDWRWLKVTVCPSGQYTPPSTIGRRSTRWWPSSRGGGADWDCRDLVHVEKLKWQYFSVEMVMEVILILLVVVMFGASDGHDAKCLLWWWWWLRWRSWWLNMCWWSMWWVVMLVDVVVMLVNVVGGDAGRCGSDGGNGGMWSLWWWFLWWGSKPFVVDVVVVMMVVLALVVMVMLDVVMDTFADLVWLSNVHNVHCVLYKIIRI